MAEKQDTTMVSSEEDLKNLEGALNGKGGDNPPATPPATPPAAETPPATPPAASAAEPPKDDKTPPATPPAAADDKGNPPATPPAAADDEVMEITNLFGGKYDSIEKVESDLNRIPELEAQLKEAREAPKFASDRAKMLYDYANKFEGMELNAFQSMLHVQGLTVKDLSDQQARYEAFKLSDEARGLSEENARILFADNEAQFGDPDNAENPQTPAQKLRAERAAETARGKLSQMQKEFNEAKPAERPAEDVAQERARLQTSAETALTGFKGIQSKVMATGENGEKLESQFNFAIDKPDQIKAILEGMVSPQQMWEAMLTKDGIVDQAGNVDMRKFGELAAEVLFRRERVQEAYSQGHKDGIAYKVKTARNPGTPPAGGGAPPAEPAPKSDKEGLGEAAFKAITGQK